ncbi:hypothetical protein GR160_14920 [Flavobacterium sp. Sd200]|uniref:patatin-like phospholipase family protein n=1 Tax=Flavobacterium sp. Sd200 TaxID=2692211 RepID=UPI00136C7D9A|nr:patatin-like phospholipase family protein [Flavobacterium sp. Sd200]MXN92520.1 hypothetical protein [Flavobacterium sp. Sd200]
MDIVTDLNAQAVAYITLFQDILKNDAVNGLSDKLAHRKRWNELDIMDIQHKILTPNQHARIKDLVWHSPTKYDRDKLKSRYFNTVIKLYHWLYDNIVKPPIIFNVEIEIHQPAEKNNELFLFRPPFFWREQIRAVLYRDAQQRIELSAILQYIPLQVILTLAGQEKKAYFIRLYQFYKPFKDDSVEKADSTDYTDILSKPDCIAYRSWWKGKNEEANALLLKDNLLLNELKMRGFPLPFETLLRDELIEIEEARCRRAEEFDITSPNNNSQSVKNNSVKLKTLDVFDPFVKANEMELMGIAFSGGGIRSATFNLGILQKLASLNVLHKFDYISTVSGGGYIGTWFNSWIKRSGSFSKVNDQLSPTKSGDPLADEVRPLRWLRMFSNYLSPNTGIMSSDAWASGMTWLRNTVINQFVLMLTLLTVLSFIEDIFALWKGSVIDMITQKSIGMFCYSFIIFFTGALLIAVAMRSFHTVEHKTIRIKFPDFFENIKFSLSSIINFSKTLPALLVVWACLSALIITTYFLAKCDTSKEDITDLGLHAAFAAFLAFIWVAAWGNYHKRKDIMQLGLANIYDNEQINSDNTSAKVLVAVFLSSIVSAAILIFLLVLFWTSLADIYTFIEAEWGIDPKKVILIFGVPLVLEIFSVSVIVRMALMGELFPDYRREWWGRIGGNIHRFMLLWIVVSFASLLMPDVWENDVKKYLLSVLPGGAVIVGWGVKKAFEATSIKEEQKKLITNLVIKISPFVFLIIMLLSGSYIIKEIRENFGSSDLSRWIITLILALTTLILSWRVGVNEFSLHHFYRNRLIRAFLGATRTREERTKSENAYTGFDSNDDILLSSFQTKYGYSGPFPIINSALNATVVSALDRQDRMAESFVFSPLYCGYDFSPTRPSTYDIDHVYEYGYRPTDEYSNEKGGPTIGTAMAISGAAVNPNWGYHSSPGMAFLLTMFNVRLGWWIGNPRLRRWKRSDPNFGLLYLIRDLMGKSDIDMNYVCLSDGGHFDNMGLYELVRRKCSYILLGDAEQDQETACEGLANAIRRCRIDFGVEIVISISAIENSSAHVVKGDIIYPGTTQKQGTLVYVKASLTKDEPVDIREYKMANPDFPQQSTADQFFDEAQFESYRKLGYHSINSRTQIGL